MYCPDIRLQDMRKNIETYICILVGIHKHRSISAEPSYSVIEIRNEQTNYPLRKYTTVMDSNCAHGTGTLPSWPVQQALQRPDQPIRRILQPACIKFKGY
jgi:hypothetical protein